MNLPSSQWITDTLGELEQSGAKRELFASSGKIDFCSNDYLGFARSAELGQLVAAKVAQQEGLANGSTGSRLLSGHSLLFDRVERQIADFHGAQDALIFNSGYDANLGLISSVADRHDTIILDELSHASIFDGARLSLARKLKFAHNDLSDLKKKIYESRGKIFVVVESLYSMDGDIAPLKDIAALCVEQGSSLIIDEAHANGVMGPQGRGLAVEEDIAETCFARTYTFGKALGSHGAAIVGSTQLKEFLVNFARPLIYSTAMPAHSLLQIEAAYEMLLKANVERKALFEVIGQFRKLSKESSLQFLESDSAIQGVIIPGNIVVQEKAKELQNAGFDVRAVRSPTVKAGQERLRICLHSFNTPSEISALLSALG